MNHKEPKPDTRKVIAPKTLSDEARKHWKTVVKHLGTVITVMDQDALAIYCELYAQWIDAGNMIKKKGMVIADPRYAGKKTDEGEAITVPVMSPYFRASMKLADQMKQMLCEFGMTPSSRTRIRADNPTAEDEFDAWQKKRRMAREGV